MIQGLRLQSWSFFFFVSLLLLAFLSMHYNFLHWEQQTSLDIHPKSKIFLCISLDHNLFRLEYEKERERVEDILFQTALSSCLVVVYTRGRVSFKSRDGELSLSCFKNKKRFLRRQKENRKRKKKKEKRPSGRHKKRKREKLLNNLLISKKRVFEASSLGTLSIYLSYIYSRSFPTMCNPITRTSFVP